MRHLLLLPALLLSSTAVLAQTAPDALLTTVKQRLAEGPAGTRYGLLVTTLEGEEILSILPDQRFIPASNTKMFVTATAYAQLPALDKSARGTGVRLEQGEGGLDVVLYGRGDARLSSAADCKLDCLQTLADAVAAKTRRVRHVVGDDSWFPDERWGPGMSWNNIQSRYGTGISALTLDDNEIIATVTPGSAVGATPAIASSTYYEIDNRVLTVPGKERHIAAIRMPNSAVLRLTGTIGAEAEPTRLYFGVDDPAHYAAWRLRDLLKERGVAVSGTVQVRHRPLTDADDPADRKGAPAVQVPAPEMLAELPALPLAEDVVIINKVSQNLHADLMLRRVAREGGSGSIADGQAALKTVMTQAGLPAASYEFADGSGMSSYNRITPRGAVTLLSWAAKQSWGAAWRASLPVGGVDGTLRSRFKDTLLDGKLCAKTGSLNASRALSGYLVTKSGRTLIFSAIANDIPESRDDEATAAVDKALLAIADAR